MHLALQNADGSYTPYNENYGIFFARSPKAQKLNENLDGNDYRSLKDPSLFRMADGTYGVISVRTNRGTATGDSTAKSSVLIATSEDLLTYSEQENSGSIVDLGETNGVNAPYAVYDTASKQYVVGWADDNGVAKYTTFDSLKGSTSSTAAYCTVPSPSPAYSPPTVYRASRTSAPVPPSRWTRPR